MLNSPLVSVYITTFNRCKLLERAVDSVLNQTFRNFELIIVDDCSTDNTQDFINKVCIRDKRVRFFINDENKGACFSRNLAIDQSIGTYITGLDDDDYFIENRLTNFVSKFNPKYSFYCTSPILLNNGYKKSYCFNGIISYGDLIYDNSAGNQFFTLKSRLHQIGGFDESLSSSQDLDIMLRLAIEFGPAYRLHDFSYITDISHISPRISTSSKKLDGMRHFFFKHFYLMSFRQKLYHLILISYWGSSSNLRFLYLLLLSLLNPRKFFIKIYNIFSCNLK